MPRPSRSLAALVLVLAFAGSQAARAQSVYPIIMSIDPVAVEIGKTTTCEIVVQKTLNGGHHVREAALERSGQVLIMGEGITGQVLPQEIPPAEVAPTTAPALAKASADKAPAVPVKAPPPDQAKSAPEKSPTEKSATEKAVTEKSPGEKKQADQTVAETKPADKSVEKKEPEKTAPDKSAAEKSAAEKSAAEKSTAEKSAAEKKEADAKAAEKIAAEKIAAEKIAAGKKEAEKKAAEKLAADKKAAEKKAAEKKPEIDRVKIAFTVSADAEPGPRQFRFIGPHGASTLAEIVVVRDPIVRETPKNNTLDGAQPVTLPASLCGRIEDVEDTDHYKFHAREGSFLVFQVHASRLQDCIYEMLDHIDPVLTLRDARGTMLARNDNYFAADSMLAFRIPVDGDYDLEVRDVRYRGSRAWPYCVEASERPLVETAYPLQIVPGEQAVCEALGPNLPDNRQIHLAAAADLPEGLEFFTPQVGGAAANRVPFLVCSLPRILEANRANNTPATAQAIAVPSCIGGRIEQEEDVDCYRFAAAEGERFNFEVVARRAQSSLDANLRILDAADKPLAENDDMKQYRAMIADSRIVNWTAPADGNYTLEVRDVNLAGGPAAVYCVLAKRARPAFQIETSDDRTLVAPNSSAAILVRAYREAGFEGEIQLAIDGLPAGVTADCGKVLAGSNEGCIVVTAAPDAKLTATNIVVRGTASQATPEGKLLSLSATAQPLEEIYTPGGGRSTYPVRAHTLSVNEPVDVRSVQLDKQEVVLKPGQSATVGATIDRREGFQQGILVDVVSRHLEQILHNCLPPGVTLDAKKSTLYLAGDQTKASIVLMAAEDAPEVSRHQVAIYAHISLTFVAKYTVSSKPLFVSVKR